MIDSCSRAGLVALVLIAASGLVVPVSAQAEGGPHATRTELEAILAAASQPASREAQANPYYDAARVRQRLEEGDFQPGDQIRVRVEGYSDLSDTFVVDPNRELILPVIGSIPLRGVLRSELQSHLTESIGRYIRDPQVRTESTIRLVVLGGVGSPGYHSVPSHAQLTELFDTAGGTTRTAQITRMRVERNGARILGGNQLHQAVIAGRSVDQLGLQAGDHFVIPESTRWRQVLAVTSGVSSIVWLVWRVNRMR
jgi:protein involved in polysaccharide export with SLBB domain